MVCILFRKELRLLDGTHGMDVTDVALGVRSVFLGASSLAEEIAQASKVQKRLEASYS